MLVATLLDAAILDTVLGRLAFLFLSGAGGDPALAHQAASRMVAAYKPETEQELSLTAEIISFSFHALEALSQATQADLPLNKIIRLRSSAVSLNRGAHRNQRKLDQLQRARRTAVVAQPADHKPPLPEKPTGEQAATVTEIAHETVVAAGKSLGKTWTQAYHERQTNKRIAERIRRQQAQHATVAARQPKSLPASMLMPPDVEAPMALAG